MINSIVFQKSPYSSVFTKPSFHFFSCFSLNNSYWCVLRREFSGMIHFITFVTSSSQQPPVPSIPYVKRTSKSNMTFRSASQKKSHRRFALVKHRDVRPIFDASCGLDQHGIALQEIHINPQGATGRLDLDVVEVTLSCHWASPYAIIYMYMYIYICVCMYMNKYEKYISI